jgi:hypothetical protein
VASCDATRMRMISSNGYTSTFVANTAQRVAT